MKFKYVKWLAPALFMTLAAFSVVAQNKEEAPKSTPIALTVEAIQELEKRKQELDNRERELNERAQALATQEKLLKEKIAKMEELQNRMSERLDKFKKEHEGKVDKLVSMVESMRPQAAAEYVENLDPELAVQIISRIQVARAARIMNLVDKKKGARLSELYTGYLEKITNNTSVKQDDKGVPQNTQM